MKSFISAVFIFVALGVSFFVGGKQYSTTEFIYRDATPKQVAAAGRLICNKDYYVQRNKELGNKEGPVIPIEVVVKEVPVYQVESCQVCDCVPDYNDGYKKGKSEGVALGEELAKMYPEKQEEECKGLCPVKIPRR